MGCKMKIDSKDSLKLEQFVKSSLYRDINIMLKFSKRSMLKKRILLKVYSRFISNFANDTVIRLTCHYIQNPHK